MSYDLAVYLPEALDAEVLTALVDASIGLQLEEIADGGSGDGPQNWHILRGKRAAYCFTLEGPFLVEPEDVPHEVTAAVLGAGVMYSILVEGAEPVSIVLSGLPNAWPRRETGRHRICRPKRSGPRPVPGRQPGRSATP